MAITGQCKRRRIVINADAYISSATSNVPVLVKFNSTSHPDLFGTGDDKDSVWFSSDASGQTTLYHEGVVFDSTDAIFYVKVDLSSTADTTIYFWYGTPAITGTESPANVWYQFQNVYHFENNANDSTGTSNGSVTGATYSSSGKVAGCYSFDGNDYISLLDTIPSVSDGTYLLWYNISSNDDYQSLIADDGAGYCLINGTYSRAKVQFAFYDTGAINILETNTHSTSTWYLVMATWSSSDSNRLYINGVQQGTGLSAGNAGGGSTNLRVGKNGTNYFTGLIDEVWIHTTALTADFAVAIYNNVQNYETFVTIDGAVSVGGTPKLIIPVWTSQANYNSSVSAAVGLSAAVSTQADLIRSVSSSIGISASVSITGDFSIPKYWGISIVHGVTTTDLYGENIIESATITDQLGKRSDEFEIRLYNNSGTYSNSFTIGDDVYLYIGDESTPTTKKFHGVITSIEFDLPYTNKNIMILQGVDYGSFRLGQTMVVGVREYIEKTPTEIIQHLLSTYCPDITYTNVETFEDTIPNIKFQWEYISECIEMIATLVGADYYVDEDDDLHFYDNSSLSVDHTIHQKDIISARILKDSFNHYDRVFVIGGKEKYLDVENTTATTSVNTYSKHYASQFVPSKSNLFTVYAYIKKVGIVPNDLPFEIVENNENDDPLGDIVGWGTFPSSNITSDAAWVQSTQVNVQLNVGNTYWVVFKRTGTDESNTYQIYHDNSTADGHSDSDDGITVWAAHTGLLAFKTYYGVQIIKESNATTKIAGDYYTDVVIVEPTVEDFDTAEILAEQKIAEYTLKHTSTLNMRTRYDWIRSGDVLDMSLDGLPEIENQTVLSTEITMTEPTIIQFTVRTTPTLDFYTTFAGLFADLRKLKIKAMYENSNISNDYHSESETITPSDTATVIEALTSYAPQYDDVEAIWDVSKWQ